jgi:hypothetical protein
MRAYGYFHCIQRDAPKRSKANTSDQESSSSHPAKKQPEKLDKIEPQ